MAFNLAVFKTRTLTAIVFVAVMLTGLLLNHWSFFILFSIIHFGCWIEYQKLVTLIDPGYKNISLVHKYGVMIAGWMLMWSFANYEFNLNGFEINAIAWWWPIVFFAILPFVDWLHSKNVQLKNTAHSVFGLIYISVCWGLMMNLYGIALNVSADYYIKAPAFEKDVIYPTAEFNHKWLLPVIIIACMWINDTMAYIVGSLFGKTPFSKISPKKTWEGTLGGIGLCIVIVGLLLTSDWMSAYEPVLYGISPIHWFIIPAIAAIAGTAGDLFESKLKRLAGVKDSGTLMPGHGGFLDRFDSLLIATPFIWLYVALFMK